MEDNSNLDDFMIFENDVTFCEDENILHISGESFTILQNFDIESVGMNVGEDLLNDEQRNDSDSTFCETPNSDNNLMIFENNNDDTLCESTQITDECTHISQSQNEFNDVNYKKYLHSKIKNNNRPLSNMAENIKDKSLTNRVTNYFGTEDTNKLTKQNTEGVQFINSNANVGKNNSYFTEPTQNNKNEFNNKKVPNAAPTKANVKEFTYDMSFNDHFSNNNLVITTIIDECSQNFSIENIFNSNEISSAEINKNMYVNVEVVNNKESGVCDINMPEPLYYENCTLNKNSSNLAEINNYLDISKPTASNNGINDVFDINMSEPVSYENSARNCVITNLPEINKNIHIIENRVDNKDMNNVFETNMKITAMNKKMKVSEQVVNDNQRDVFEKKLLQSNKNLKIHVDVDVTQNDENKRKVRLLNDNNNNIAFKVLEELNKVKNYLIKTDNIETSGSRRRYRIIKSEDSQNSININESAYCLLNFITTCALVPQNDHITEQISIVLGKLIDKLYKEDQYPSFLEKLLESIDGLIKYIYEGNDCDNDIINKKVKAISRLYLLNRSSHIIKFSIQKITKILEETLENIKLEVFEIRHIEKVENLPHIFNILEFLLEEYIQIRNNASQNCSEMSLDEGGLKKSALTQVWREKWNLSKSQVYEGSTQNDNFLSECKEILNKITVEAMEGYCLVAFAALQCYNLLHN